MREIQNKVEEEKEMQTIRNEREGWELKQPMMWEGKAIADFLMQCNNYKMCSNLFK